MHLCDFGKQSSHHCSASLVAVAEPAAGEPQKSIWLSEGQTSATQCQWEDVKGLGSCLECGLGHININLIFGNCCSELHRFHQPYEAMQLVLDSSPTRKRHFGTEKVLFGQLWREEGLNSLLSLLFKLTYMSAQWAFGNYLYCMYLLFQNFTLQRAVQKSRCALLQWEHFKVAGVIALSQTSTFLYLLYCCRV